MNHARLMFTTLSPHHLHLFDHDRDGIRLSFDRYTNLRFDYISWDAQHAHERTHAAPAMERNIRLTGESSWSNHRPCFHRLLSFPTIHSTTTNAKLVAAPPLDGESESLNELILLPFPYSIFVLLWKVSFRHFLLIDFIFHLSNCSAF